MNAFTYVQEKGLALINDYKYTAKIGKCKDNKVRSPINLKISHFLPYKHEETIKKMPIESRLLPISINEYLLQFYKEGILDAEESKCDPGRLNHGVAILGYGSESDREYWIIRNS